MKIALIIIALIIAVIGWFKRDSVPPYITIIVVVLLVAFAVIQIVIKVRESKEEDKSKYSGVLKSQVKTLLSSDKNVYPKLELGDGGTIFSYSGPEGKPLFKIFEDSHLTILREEGQVKVSLIIRSREGIVAELINNEWKVNPNKIFDRNYSRDALEVKDNFGDIVLQVKHVWDRIQFQGKFYDAGGNGVAFVRHPSGEGGLIEKIGVNRPELELKIEPIFKYPSDLHLGELNK